MVLAPGARIAIIGAGPSGLVTAKHALDAGLDPTVFEASGDLGGQWCTSAAHSGVWPGMHTNTSRAMTAFSDLAPPDDWPLHPAAESVHEYLRSYARAFGIDARIRWHTKVRSVRPGWLVDDEPFDAVVVASGRFRRPVLPDGVDQFGGLVLHAFDYPGAEAFRDRRVLVYGNGISGHEIASDLAGAALVVSAYRKPRYVLQKVVDGMPSDWQWYTHVGALERRVLPRSDFAALLRARVLRIAGDPADFGAPAPDDDILIAGVSLCQDYLQQVADRRITCRPAITSIAGHTVTFSDGSTEIVDAVVCATGYELDIPYLTDEVWSAVGHDLSGLHLRTLPVDLDGFAAVGQFLAQGPYFGLLELQARWVVAAWTGAIAQRPHVQPSAPPPVLDPHNALATAIAEELGVLPDPTAWPELAESLLFGPMLPIRYRFQGPGAIADAPDRFGRQLAAGPTVAVTRSDIEGLARLGHPEWARLCASPAD